MAARFPSPSPSSQAVTDCPQCQELCVGASILPCGHLTCRKCLRDHLGSTLTCATCRHALVIPKGQGHSFEQFVQQLGSDPVVQQIVILQLSYKHWICMSCENREATRICLDCRDTYCDTCSKAHKKMTPSKDHEQMTLPQAVRNVSKSSSSTSETEAPLWKKFKISAETSSGEGSSGQNQWKQWVETQMGQLQEAARDQHTVILLLRDIMSLTQQLLTKGETQEHVLQTYMSCLSGYNVTEQKDLKTFAVTSLRYDYDVHADVKTDAMECRLRDVTGRRHSASMTTVETVRKQLKSLLDLHVSVLHTVSESDNPGSLVNKLSEERRLETQMRKERGEAHLYMDVMVLLEDDLCGHQGNDLFDSEKTVSRTFKVKKMATLVELMEMLSEQLKHPVQHLRPWPFIRGRNHTFRPTMIDLEAETNTTIQELADEESPWTVFVETPSPGSDLTELPPFDKDNDLLFFLKLYNPRFKAVSYCGHFYVPISTKAIELVPELNRKAGFPVNTPLMIFEEVNPYMVKKMHDLSLPIEKLIEEVMDGNIIVFQREDDDFANLEFPTAKEYFRSLAAAPVTLKQL